MNATVRYFYSLALIEAREKKKITQARAAELCHLSVRQYQRFEGGDALPRLDRAFLIAITMGLSLDDIVRKVKEKIEEDKEKDKNPKD